MVVTGPPESGKSTAASAVHDALEAAGTANALVELDELARSYPPLPHERAAAHLRAICTEYRESGCALLLVTATVETDAETEAVLAATGPAERLVVRLEADQATLERAILDRG